MCEDTMFLRENSPGISLVFFTYVRVYIHKLRCLDIYIEAKRGYSRANLSLILMLTLSQASICMFLCMGILQSVLEHKNNVWHMSEKCVYSGVRIGDIFLCCGAIVLLIFMVLRFFVVLGIRCCRLLVSFTGSCTADEPEQEY